MLDRVAGEVLLAKLDEPRGELRRFRSELVADAAARRQWPGCQRRLRDADPWKTISRAENA